MKKTIILTLSIFSSASYATLENAQKWESYVVPDGDCPIVFSAPSVDVNQGFSNPQRMDASTSITFLTRLSNMHDTPRQLEIVFICSRKKRGALPSNIEIRANGSFKSIVTTGNWEYYYRISSQSVLRGRQWEGQLVFFDKFYQGNEEYRSEQFFLCIKPDYKICIYSWLTKGSKTDPPMSQSEKRTILHIFQGMKIQN